MNTSKFELAYISRNGSTWTCVHPATKQANYCCIPFVSKFFWKVYLSSSSLVSSYMLLNVPHPFCSPWNATQVTPDSCSKVSLRMPDSRFNNLRCLCLLSCCGAVSFYLPWLSLLALSLLSLSSFGELSRPVLKFLWAILHPRPYSLLSIAYPCPLSPNKLAPRRQFEVLLLLNWAELLSSKIKFVCFPLLSVHVWPLT